MEFLPTFMHTGKSNYVKIVLGMMDKLYSEVDPSHLHLLRMNRPVPLYNGNDNQGNPMGNWAMD
eukprot:365670-Ditylum_brightwellii.AAC.1